MSAAEILEFQARPSARGVLREFVRNVVEGEDEINTQEIIEYAERRFENDEDFHRTLLRDGLSILVPAIVKDVIHRRNNSFANGGNAGDAMVRTAAGAVSMEAIQRTQKDKAASVFINLGQTRRSLLACTKSELIKSAERDEEQAAGSLRWAGFKRDLAKSLPNETVTPRDAIEPTNFDRIWAKHFQTD